VTNKAKVLIIDDEEIVLDSCTDILVGENVQIATALNGRLGLERVREFVPDLVFLDLKMPGLSGLEVLQQVLGHDPTMVVIVITGYATVDSAVEAMKKGAFDFLPKPFTPDEFRMVVRRGLEKRKLVLETLALRREKELLRENFAAIVSHELKAPLGALQQNLFVLSQELARVLTEEQKQRLERMKVRLDGLLKLIHAWLRVLSADIEKIREQFHPVSMAAVIANAVECVQPQADRANVQMEVTLAEPSVQVLGDEGTLGEALINLLSNAVKYSHAGGRVLLRAGVEEGRCVIRVRDWGIGIPSEDLPLILGGFAGVRAGPGGEKGCGLGLALTRRIVEAHDGSIAAESEPGKGTTFVVSLPALPAASPAALEHEPELVSRSQRGSAE
jgi:signal transduction histidine kinase